MRQRIHRHQKQAITEAATRFFAVRGLLRTTLAQGKRLDPYKWLRVETMVYIRDHEGASMKELAGYLAITAPSATSIVNALKREGFVERRQDPRDKRIQRLHLSPTGKRALAKKIASGMHLLAGLFAPLSPRELAAFSGLLAKIERSERS